MRPQEGLHRQGSSRFQTRLESRRGPSAIPAPSLTPTVLSSASRLAFAIRRELPVAPRYCPSPTTFRRTGGQRSPNPDFAPPANAPARPTRAESPLAIPLAFDRVRAAAVITPSAREPVPPPSGPLPTF